MEAVEKLQKHYDHILIGYNLTSLAFAAKLAEQNLKFCILDSKHIGSSLFKNVPSAGCAVYSRAPYAACNPEIFANTNHGFFDPATPVESTPLTFDKGEFRSLLGFGDTKMEAMDAVLPFCKPNSVQVELIPEAFWQSIQSAIEPRLFLDQQITEVHFTDEQVTHITLNGTTRLDGGKFYFFDHFEFLIDQIGSKVKKVASQFAKAQLYSSIALIVHHKTPPAKFEVNSLYLLKGSKMQACLGMFTSHNGQLISRWESFFPKDLTPDSETTGACLKEIKKQVKRAFSADDSLPDPEHIVIHNSVYADLEKSDIKNGKVNNFNNLYWFSPLFDGSIGFVHEILTGIHGSQSLNEDWQKSAAPSRIDVAALDTPC